MVNTYVSEGWLERRTGGRGQRVVKGGEASDGFDCDWTTKLEYLAIGTKAIALSSAVCVYICVCVCTNWLHT